MRTLRDVPRPRILVVLAAVIPFLAQSSGARADASVNAAASGAIGSDAQRFAFVVSEGATFYGVLGEVGDDWGTGAPRGRRMKRSGTDPFYSEVVLRHVQRERLDKDLRAWEGRGVDLYLGAARAGHAIAGTPRVLRLFTIDDAVLTANINWSRDNGEVPTSARASKAALRAWVLWNELDMVRLLAVPLSVDATSPALDGAIKNDPCEPGTAPIVWMRDASLARPLVYSPEPAPGPTTAEATRRLRAMPAWKENTQRRRTFLDEHPDAPLAKGKSRSSRNWADSTSVQQYRASGEARRFVFAVASGTVLADGPCEGDCDDLTLQASTAWEQEESDPLRDVPLLSSDGTNLNELPRLIIVGGEGPGGAQDLVMDHERLRRTGRRLERRERITCGAVADGC